MTDVLPQVPATQANPLDAFVGLLRRHDYTHQMSERLASVIRGEAEYNRLVYLAQQLPPEAVRAAIETIVPRVLIGHAAELWTARFLDKAGIA